MKVTLLGTGTSHGVPVLGCQCETCCSDDPRDNRSRSSIYIETEKTSILIDTATELRIQALQNGLKKIDVVLLTHYHSDHICGFDDLRRFNELQKALIPVYGNQETIHRIREMFSYIFNGQNEPGGGKPQIELNNMPALLDIGDVSIVPVPTIHGNLNVLGYRIGKFAYVTDCNLIPESSMRLLEELDLLILGVLRFKPHPTHLNLEQGLDIIKKLKPKRTLLTHISHDFKHSGSVNCLPDNVELGYDGLQVEVKPL